jgi:hypothetical protein
MTEATRCAFCRTIIAPTSVRRLVEGKTYHAGCWDRKARQDEKKKRMPDRQPSVTDRIRARMDAGVLRAIGPKTMWADFGQGNPCNGCGESILTSDIEYASRSMAI